MQCQWRTIIGGVACDRCGRIKQRATRRNCSGQQTNTAPREAAPRVCIFLGIATEEVIHIKKCGTCSKDHGGYHCELFGETTFPRLSIDQAAANARRTCQSCPKAASGGV